MPLDIDAVSRLLMDVAAAAILPRHRALAASDVQEKSPGELVTVADRDAESLLAAGLADLLPGVPVVGEEAAALDASTLALVEESPLLWLVDPLDGTANFVAGSPDFAMMVALVQKGDTEAAWIYRPADGQMYVAQRRAGAYANGQRLRREPAPPDVAALRGAVLTRFLSPEQKKNVCAGATQMRHVGPGRV